MKIIVTGATGLVGTEIIRQALSNPAVTSIVALARRDMPVPPNVAPTADPSKLKTVILKDWMGKIPQDVLDALSGANACLWNLAITPQARANMGLDEITRICHGYTMNCLEQIIPVASKPFRIVYTSGMGVERDQAKRILLLGDYLRMRGRVETDVLALAAKHSLDVETITARPGFITGPTVSSVGTLFGKYILPAVGYLDWVHVSECAAALLEQALLPQLSPKDPLENEDLRAAGRRLVQKQDYVK